VLHFTFRASPSRLALEVFGEEGAVKSDSVITFY
jgi:hypothetical protein